MATTHTLLMKTKTVTEDDARGANKSATTVLATAGGSAARVDAIERQDGMSTIFFHVAGTGRSELGEDALFDASSTHRAIMRKLRGVAGLSVVRDIDGTDGRGFCVAIMCFLRQHQEVR